MSYKFDQETAHFKLSKDEKKEVKKYCKQMSKKMGGLYSMTTFYKDAAKEKIKKGVR